MKDEFWKRKSLAEMSADEWESLCDGCALCCMQKLEDEESGEIFYTDLACRLLNINTCRCKNYPARAEEVADCLVLAADNVAAFRWLPATCAYRLLAEGEALPEWHPLLTGNPDSVHEAGISVKGQAVSKSGEWTVLRKLGDS
ncbi:MAG: YcgN family cysteine cluster protein [Woeseiaceae bacterium]